VLSRDLPAVQFPGATVGPGAADGYQAMNAVLAALRGAGGHANNRPAVIRAFTPPPAARLRLVD
jgi:hypothetical protein